MAVNDDGGQMFLARFHQVGAFFPFSRNHNTIGVYDEENKKLIYASINQAPHVIENDKYKNAVKMAFV